MSSVCKEILSITHILLIAAFSTLAYGQSNPVLGYKAVFTPGNLIWVEDTAPEDPLLFVIPETPANLLLPGDLTQSMLVTWDESELTDRYVLEMKHVDGDWAVVYEGSDLSWDMANEMLLQQGSYKLRIMACTSACSAYSAEVPAELLSDHIAIPPPSFRDALTVYGLSIEKSTSGDEATISWHNVPNASRYLVFGFGENGEFERILYDGQARQVVLPIDENRLFRIVACDSADDSSTCSSTIHRGYLNAQDIEKVRISNISGGAVYLDVPPVGCPTSYIFIQGEHPSGTGNSELVLNYLMTHIFSKSDFFIEYRLNPTYNLCEYDA